MRSNNRPLKIVHFEHFWRLRLRTPIGNLKGKVFCADVCFLKDFASIHLQFLSKHTDEYIHQKMPFRRMPKLRPEKKNKKLE